jgi:geranylgeranyl pyrophosphate synthase
MIEFEKYLATCLKRVEDFLKQATGLINTLSLPTPLYPAIQYSLFNGGKRLRPLLVYATGEALNVPLEQLHAPAAAVELIHCYSLIHDDLPAMDDDDFRRGKPTCHKAFDEATAILAGDALQTLAFEILSNAEMNPNPAAQQIKMVRTLAQASGMHGMVGGQALDIMNADQNLSLTALTQLHQKKTGALISASITLAVLAADLDNRSDNNSENSSKKSCENRTENSILRNATLKAGLHNFGEHLGLLFQVQDDILDVEGSLEGLGKTPGKDKQQNKTTFPSLLGLEEAKRYAALLQKQAMESLHALPLSPEAHTRFTHIAEYVLQRKK